MFRYLAESYMAQFTGRDHAVPAGVDRWVARCGDRLGDEIANDEVFAGLEELPTTPALTFRAKDADGHAIMRPRGLRAPAARSASASSRRAG